MCAYKGNFDHFNMSYLQVEEFEGDWPLKKICPQLPLYMSLLDLLYHLLFLFTLAHIK